MKENLCIIGCGWLGQFVGIELISRFDHVYASYRSEATRIELDQLGFKTFHLDLDNGLMSVPMEIAKNTDVLLIALPPFDRQHPDRYGDTLGSLAKQFNPEIRIIFTSSIGIYPSENGNFNEGFECNEQNVLCHAENTLREIASERLIILRLGGLIGGQRHPVKFLSGKHISNNGHEPINLIHRKDISRLISHLLNSGPESGILNVLYTLDINKRSYYNTIAEKLGLPLPNWGSEPSNQRIISTEKLQKLNGFDLIFNPLEFTFE